MIIAKGEFCTHKIRSCIPNQSTRKYDITFNNGSVYSYARNNVVFMSNPTVIGAQDYMVETPEGKKLFGIRAIYEFDDKREKYWHIVFDSFECDYKKSDLKISENCLKDKKSSNLFEYLKEISGLNELSREEGGVILERYYEKVGFVSNDTVLSRYLNPDKKGSKHSAGNLIFPFGCNQSQYHAVRNALENQISIIQGPPGTGKTQTILNIIANLLINGKSVLVVSNNNSATQNILDKLSGNRYGLNFIVAPLGSMDNKNEFIEAQVGEYPNLFKWSRLCEGENSLREIADLVEKLQNVYRLQEEVARLKEKRYEIELELKHFEEYASDTAAYYKAIRVRGERSSGKIMQLWQELQDRADRLKKLSIWFKLKSIFYYGIADWSFYQQDLSKIITVLQGMYYQQSLKETLEQLETYESRLSLEAGDYGERLEEESLKFLKKYIVNKYTWWERRQVFTVEDLYRNSADVLREYPIILSSTFSARASLNVDVITYDYVIMDEASQVDIATGALALSCARNAVIVGDLKQLPNVVTSSVYSKAKQIRERYAIGDVYDFTQNSFLQSVVKALPDAPSTLLREHYRCHPRIISFCNQKFYNNELIIMTEDDNSNEALMAIKTVEGNHARGNYNQRQIDVIKEEILPALRAPLSEIGIIAPYNDQVYQIQSQIPGIEAATVHKFQGREKDVIILSTVDNQIRDFTDNPYLLNVAVSRAKKKLIVVISGNKQSDKGNIVDLVSYIEYNKMEVRESRVYSVFDFLYSQYREQRWKYLKNKKRVSEYDSENLTYNLLLDILQDYSDYGILCFIPLFMIIRDLSKLTEEEIRYALNPATHVDFLVYNRLSKLPLAAVETDGYMYHKEGTAQHERDEKKNRILEACGLSLVRLNTTGSNEREKILSALEIG